MTTTKVYLVTKGRKTGIFNSWKDASKQVIGYKGAQHRSFDSKEAAEKFWATIQEAQGETNSSSSPQHIRNALPVEGQVLIFTDGSACDGKTGYGIVAIKSDGTRITFSDATPYTTNNQAELFAILKSLQEFPDDALTIYSDSTYTIDSLTFNIYEWKENGWKKSNGKDIENRALIEKIFNNLEERGNVKFRHVDAHKGILLNELADQLAKDGRSK